jgi:hypothetical protein
MMPELSAQQQLPNIWSAWVDCKKYIEPSVKFQDLYSIEDIESKLLDGSFQLWPGQNSAYITEIARFPQKTVCNMIFCGGDYQELEDLLPLIEEFSNRCGATRMYGGGRKGWLRKLKHLGFKSEHLISKEI